MMRTLTYWLSLVLLFSIPFEKIIAIGGRGSPTITKFFGLFVAAVWLASIFISDKFRKPRPFHILVLLFVLWNIVTIFWSFNIDESISRATTYVQLFGLVLMFWDLYTTSQAVRAALQAFVLGCYVSVISTLWNFITGVTAHQYITRYTATGFSENEISLILALGMPMAWYLAVFVEDIPFIRQLKLINYGYVPLALLAVLLTASRGGLISTLPAFMFIMVTFTQLKIIPRIIIFLAFVGALFAVQAFVPASSYERLSKTGDEISSGDLTGRVTIWSQGIEAFADHPLLGVGTGAFRYSVEKDRAAHNAYLEVLVESGLIGFALFALVLILSGYHALILRRWDSRLWLTLLLIWAIGVAALSLHYRKPTWLILGFPIIAANAYKAREEMLTEDSASPVSLPQSTPIGQPTNLPHS